MRPSLLVTIPLLALAVGCGGPSSSASPTTTAGGLAAGATINGTVVSPGSASLSAPVPPIANLTVTVAGTNVGATVDGSNRFVLRGVPAGDVELRFSAPTVSATVGLSAVQTTETIAIGVSFSGSSAAVEAARRSSGSAAELEGRVEELPPPPATSPFVVAGQMVTTDTNTRYFRGGDPATFADLAIGYRVHISGQMNGSALLASVVTIQNTNPDIPVEINGMVSDFTGAAAAFEFDIDDRLIKGDANTEFFGNSAFGDLANGVRAEVKGLQRNGYVYATRIHVEADDGGGQSASIEGLLTSKTGAVPSLVLVVGGTTVRTSSSTDVQRRGDNQDLSALALNMTLHVVGIRQSDGSIDARFIQIKDDGTGGVFEIEGPLGGLHGTCPSITFGVNGYSIFTDAATVFTPACSTFKSGNKVKVKGVVQAGGSVKATTVDKQ
jgi:hypothetical protein